MVYETRRDSVSVSVLSVDASIAESGCEGSGEEADEFVEEWGAERCRTASGFGRVTNLPSRR